MSESSRQLLTIGVFFITVVVALLLSVIVLADWFLFIPIVLVLSGLWALSLAGIRASKPQKYERGTFSTMALGLCMIAVGGAWYLFAFGWLYSLVLILLVLGALAITAALRRK
jgi:hypothetical protein